MKRYQFRLASVLRVRRIQEEQARADLIAANQSVRAAHLHVASRVAHLESLPKSGAVASTPAFLANQARLASVASSISIARIARQVAEEAATEKRHAWQVTAQRVESLERLDDRAHTEHTLETQRAADKEVDDLVVSRFRQQQRPGTGVRR
jgi:flagellar FliJ protein